MYEGCSKSCLSAVVDFLIIKSEAGIAEKYYDRLMSTIKGLLPDGDLLVENYYQTRKFVKKLGLSQVKIHACPTNCILYYDDHTNKDVCPTCGHPRFRKIHCKSTSRKSSGIPYK